MAGMTYGIGNTTKSGWGRALSAVVAVLGLWQIAAPFVLNFADEQIVFENAIVSGALLAGFAALAFFGAGRWSPSFIRAFAGLAALTGLWLVISPWVLDYQALVPAFWSALLVGLIGLLGAGFAAWKQPDSTSF